MINRDYIVNQQVFKKTKEEKAKAYTAKKNWERTMKMYYGVNWKKHNNYPFTLTDI